MDSCVLLNALAEIRKDLGVPVEAIHINHGLQTKALKWEQFCRETCARLDIRFSHLQLSLRPAAGESLEAQARDARYSAIAGRMEADEALLTAHHGDDQVETFLLQLLRGAGVSGLASMPCSRQWEAGWLMRPLLEFSRGDLLTWAQQQKLQWQEDPSNQSLHIRRNFLRHKVIPLLKDQWPGVISTTGRSARHCAEAAHLMREVGTSDLALISDAGKPWRLLMSALDVLSPQRQKNLLRYWIRHQGLPVPGHQVIERVLSEVMQAQQTGSPLLTWKSGEIRRYRNHLYLMPPLMDAPQEDVKLDWNVQSTLELPEGLGQLSLKSGIEWKDEVLCVVFRTEGLKCRPGKTKRNRSFKRLCQDYAIPPWVRSRLPLIYRGDDLIAVADYCLCDEKSDMPSFVWKRPEWLR
jgi:tRNA(Ile)-lysidine synthase